MRQIFALDGPVNAALGKIADIVVCNVMFLLLSLPVFTIGASLTGLYTAMQMIAAGTEPPLIVKVFWTGFYRNFKQATVVWLLCLLVIAFLAAFYWAITLLPPEFFAMYRVTFIILCIVFYMGFQYLFPMAARYRMKTGHLLKNAWLLSVAALPWTLCGIALTVAAVFVTFFMDPTAFGTMISILVFGYFSLQAYFKTLFFRRAFRRLQPQQGKE